MVSCFPFSTVTCTGDSCVNNVDQWYWYYSPMQKPLLEPYQINAVGKAISVTLRNHCMYIPSNNLVSWTDSACNSNNNNAICEFDNGGLSPTGNM